MKLSEKDESPYTRVLIFGLPGTGKSTLAARLAITHRLTWISLDNDVDVLRKLPPEAQANVNLLDLPDSASFPVASATLLQLFKTGKGRICNAHGVYTCALCTKSGTAFTSLDFTKFDSADIVVIDTGTQLGRSILSHVTKDKPVDFRPERDEWGALRKFTEFFASQFQAARFNLIVICHAVEAELEDGRMKLVPDFGSKGMSASFAAKFSHVIYCDQTNKKHKAYSKSTYANNVLTKSRTDFAIEDMAEPSLAPLFPITERKEISTLQAHEAVTVKQETVATEIQTQESQISTAKTPAQNAVVGLTDMQKRLAALASGKSKK